ncbi:MAG: PAS domain S-box protein [Desulfobacterales bacterium]|jgi:PAS domain S-box-containing protein
MDISDKPTYEELEYRVKLLEREARWREEAQRTLKEREAYLQILFEYAPDMYILCDANGRLIDANRAAEKVTGYLRREVVGKDLFEAGILDGGQFEKGINVLARVASKLSTDPEEFTIRKKNGDTIDVELRAFPVEMQDEPVVLMIARDISRFRNSIEELKQEGKRYRALFETDPEAVLVFDDDSGRILDVNTACWSLFGYEPEDMEGMHLDQLCTQSPGSRSLAEALTSFKVGTTTVAFRGFRTKAGDPLPARISVSRLSSDGSAITAIRIHL